MFYCGIDIAPTPDDLLAISTRKLTNLLTKASHGRFGEEKAKELRSAAAGSFGVGFAKNAFAFQIRQLIEQLMFSETQIEELDEQNSHLLKQVNEVITTIPGIGATLGAIIISEIGDIHRFDAPNKLVAFAGLDVKVTQRRAIWLAAQRAAFCDPILLNTTSH